MKFASNGITKLLHVNITLTLPSHISNPTRVDTASTWEPWIRIWTTCLFLDANTASMLDAGVISTWFVTHDWKLGLLQYILWKQGSRHCPVDYCWSHDVVTSKIKSYWNYRCQLMCDDLGNPKHEAEVLPVYIDCNTLQLTLTFFHNKNLEKWDLIFGF